MGKRERLRGQNIVPLMSLKHGELLNTSASMQLEIISTLLCFERLRGYWIERNWTETSNFFWHRPLNSSETRSPMALSRSFRKQCFLSQGSLYQSPLTLLFWNRASASFSPQRAIDQCARSHLFDCVSGNHSAAHHCWLSKENEKNPDIFHCDHKF